MAATFTRHVNCERPSPRHYTQQAHNEQATDVLVFGQQRLGRRVRESLGEMELRPTAVNIELPSARNLVHDEHQRLSYPVKLTPNCRQGLLTQRASRSQRVATVSNLHGARTCLHYCCCRLATQTLLDCCPKEASRPTVGRATCFPAGAARTDRRYRRYPYKQVTH